MIKFQKNQKKTFLKMEKNLEMIFFKNGKKIQSDPDDSI